MCHSSALSVLENLSPNLYRTDCSQDGVTMSFTTSWIQARTCGIDICGGGCTPGLKGNWRCYWARSVNLAITWRWRKPTHEVNVCAYYNLVECLFGGKSPRLSVTYIRGFFFFCLSRVVRRALLASSSSVSSRGETSWTWIWDICLISSSVIFTKLTIVVNVGDGKTYSNATTGTGLTSASVVVSLRIFQKWNCARPLSRQCIGLTTSMWVGFQYRRHQSSVHQIPVWEKSIS